jgi:acetylornithine deacetylase/succinyl-diaminopimelate desuccinylase-like protein
VNVETLLEDLVATPSVNAGLGGGGEAEVGEKVAGILAVLGAVVTEQPVPGQPAPNVTGTFPGPEDGPVLLLEAHLDTVPLPQRPLTMERSGGRLFGRGTCDTKGSAAAMLAALERLVDGPQLPGTLIFAGVVDEESTMAGAAVLRDRLDRVDGAIIGEPTSLRPVRVHNGFARIRLVAHGQAAHTSKAFLGRNAVSTAARVIVELEERLLPRLADRGHPLVGPPLLTAAVISGGSAPNVVPDRCEILLDRRIAPGEDPDGAVAEIDEALESLRDLGHTITCQDPFALFAGVETPEDHPLVREAEHAASALWGGAVRAQGVPYSTDACQLAAHGRIPCVVLGPGSVDQAHTVDEWIDLRELEQAVGLYEATARRFLTTAQG